MGEAEVLFHLMPAQDWWRYSFIFGFECARSKDDNILGFLAYFHQIKGLANNKVLQVLKIKIICWLIWRKAPKMLQYIDIVKETIIFSNTRWNRKKTKWHFYSKITILETSQMYKHNLLLSQSNRLQSV